MWETAPFLTFEPKRVTKEAKYETFLLLEREQLFYHFVCLTGISASKAIEVQMHGRPFWIGSLFLRELMMDLSDSPRLLHNLCSPLHVFLSL